MSRPKRVRIRSVEITTRPGETEEEALGRGAARLLKDQAERTPPHPQGMADPNKLLSIKGVCRILGINEHTFYAYRKKYSGFRTVKVGNRTYMRPERLDAFLKELEEEQA